MNAVADRIARPDARRSSISLASEDHGSAASERLNGVIADVERAWGLASDLRGRGGRRSAHHSSTRSRMTPRQGLAAAVTTAPSTTRRLLGVLAANLTLRSSACRHAIRLALAAALASALARALRLPHEYWVPLTALWLLRPDFGSTFTRGVQRYAGTTAGAVLATVFAATVHPGPYALSILATVLSVGIFCFMLANYGVTGACTTGWVVFVSALAGIPELHAAADRVLDTSLGAIIALGGYLLWPSWERGEVSDTVADVIDAARRYAAAVLGCWLDPDQAGRDTIERTRADARVIRTDTEAMLARASVGARGLSGRARSRRGGQAAGGDASLLRWPARARAVARRDRQMRRRSRQPDARDRARQRDAARWLTRPDRSSLSHRPRRSNDSTPPAAQRNVSSTPTTRCSCRRA